MMLSQAGASQEGPTVMSSPVPTTVTQHNAVPFEDNLDTQGAFNPSGLHPGSSGSSQTSPSDSTGQGEIQRAVLSESQVL